MFFKEIFLKKKKKTSETPTNVSGAGLGVGNTIAPKIELCTELHPPHEVVMIM